MVSEVSYVSDGCTRRPALEEEPDGVYSLALWRSQKATTSFSGFVLRSILS